MAELATSHILPAAIRYQILLVENIRGFKEAGLSVDLYNSQKQLLESISKHIASLSTNVLEMIEARKRCNAMENTREKAIAYCEQVKEAYFDKIRYAADKLEVLVDDKEWYLPKYRELLFLR